MRWAVDDLFERRVANHVRVVDLSGKRAMTGVSFHAEFTCRSRQRRRLAYQNAPDVDKHKETHVHKLVQWEQEREDVIRQTLCVAIDRVERVRRERSGNCRRGKAGGHGRGGDEYMGKGHWKPKRTRQLTEPLVVRLVDVLVDARVVLESVYPVDASVGKDEEEGDRKEHVCDSVIGYVLVELAVSANLCDEPWQGHEVECGESAQRGFDFEADLVFVEARVLHHFVVEDKVVGRGGKCEVEEQDADIGDRIQRDALPVG